MDEQYPYFNNILNKITISCEFETSPSPLPLRS